MTAAVPPSTGLPEVDVDAVFHHAIVMAASGWPAWAALEWSLGWFSSTDGGRRP